MENVPLSHSGKLEILRRDSFTCQYCGIKTVFLPVLRALSSTFPDRFPRDDGWTAQGTHPAYSLLSATFDHVLPLARGGTSDPENLVTSCWPCNSGKSDYTLEEMGFELLSASGSDWDGLTGVYPELCEPLSDKDLAYHLPWLKALSNDPRTDKRVQ
jgi:HNH endonuclease